MLKTGAIVVTALLLALFCAATVAQEAVEAASLSAEPGLQTEMGAMESALMEAEAVESGDDLAAPGAQERAIVTLRTLTALKSELESELATLTARAQEGVSQLEERELLAQIETLNEDIKSVVRNIQEIAAGADISSLRTQESPPFNFQEELFSLLEPAMKEMKEMTSHVREKNRLRDRIDYFSSKLPTTGQAITNLENLLQQAEDPELQATLKSMLEAWEKQRTFLQSEIQSATHQLEKLESEEVSLTESSQSFFKSFFQRRGLYLGRAIAVVLVILLLSRLSHGLMERYISGYQKAQRSFQIRLLDLTHRMVTMILLIVGPMVVFYMAEDWLLFSLGILLLLGIALTLRHAIPRYWQLMQLFLNVGTVREGERVEINGLPWLVQKINFYTSLRNPTAGITRRLKIDDLVDLRSRPTREHEVWFPCRTGDWVTLDDGNLGRVTGISEELTELVFRGGARKTLTTSNFLDCAPRCLSHNFRVKSTIGVSYALQAQAVTTICAELRAHVAQRIEDDGYAEHLLNLSVEFELANASSLDLAVIADFKGEVASAYNVLERAIQRWCVEACTEHDWEIPFTQVTIHQPAA